MTSYLYIESSIVEEVGSLGIDLIIIGTKFKSQKM